MNKYVKQGENFLGVYFIQLLKLNICLIYKRLVYNFLNNYKANINKVWTHRWQNVLSSYLWMGRRAAFRVLGAAETA